MHGCMILSFLSSSQFFSIKRYLFHSAIITVLICCVMLGQVASMTPDYAKAKQAAERVFYLLDKVPKIDVYSEDGITPVSKMC